MRIFTLCAWGVLESSFHPAIMPGLIRKLLMYVEIIQGHRMVSSLSLTQHIRCAAVDGLLLQPVGQRGSAPASGGIKITYKTNAVSASLDGDENQAKLEGLEAHGIVGRWSSDHSMEDR